MALRWWWLALPAALVVLGLAARWRRGRERPTDPVLAAHTEVLRRLPRYAVLARRELRLATVRLVGVALVLLGAVLLVGRLSDVRPATSDAGSRDVVLCLDASSSMWPVDTQVVEELGRLSRSLDGDRIGLTIWNSAAVTVFPLTDDGDYVSAQLSAAATAFRSSDTAFLAGTLPPGRTGSSQVGNGLVSCLQRFDQPAQQRSRVVVLATDNEVQGSPIFTLPQAVDRAAAAHVVVHAVAPASTLAGQVPALGQQVARTGGTLVTVGADDAAADLAARIRSLTASPVHTDPTPVLVDVPWVGGAIAALGLLLVVTPSLLRRRLARRSAS